VLEGSISAPDISPINDATRLKKGWNNWIITWLGVFDQQSGSRISKRTTKNVATTPGGRSVTMFAEATWGFKSVRMSENQGMTGDMRHTQPSRDGILRQALELPDEQKARLLDEILQHELGSSVENNRPFLEKLDEALTRLEARTRLKESAPESAVNVQNSGFRRRPDPAPAMEWLRFHGKEYGGEWVALDGGRLIAHGPDAMDVYATAEADGAYLPMITYIEPTDALPFVF
jgi:hypothetical protein